ncbi:hypothetical protein M9Y10_013238 [Tritrichomonas musculus]|uniref:Uncharacterized protein n=1 Tax=Tritrichomonas musculus TaxID=1915356 RepID=A0ABR2I7S5_9EUKA
MIQKWCSEGGSNNYKSLSCKGRLLNILNGSNVTVNKNDDLDFKGSKSRESSEQIKCLRNKLENEIGDDQLTLLYAHILTENTPMSAKFNRDFEKKNEYAVELVRDLIRLEKNSHVF